MSVENESIHIHPVAGKDQRTDEPKKRKFRSASKNRNILKPKSQVSRGCFNCKYHLSKFYYWKQCPCDSCLRSPAYYYRISSMDLVDQWALTPDSWTSRRNLLY